MAPSLADRTYALLVDDDEDDGRGDLPDVVAEAVPGNVVKQISANTLQKVGDRIVDPKTVLVWLFAALGAPTVLTGLLVPIREAGSLLPQAALVPVVRRAPRRKVVWIAGAAGQALAVAGMAVAALVAEGTTAGVAILLALAVFALSRSLTSISSKDVLGRTVPKGQRGQVTGAASMTSGIVAIGAGIALQVFGGQAADPGSFALLLGGGALLWVAGLMVFTTVREPEGAHDDSVDAGQAARALSLLREDAPFRRFVVARTLLLVSALAPPYVVNLATTEGDLNLSGLGPFVVAQGIASLVGGRLWGRLADRSSRRVIVLASASASGIVALFLAATAVDGLAGSAALHPLTYFLLALAHTGARIGRKTYVVDLAEGNRRTDYVAVANTAMGVLLLLTGAVSAGLATFGARWALLMLAVLGLGAIPVGRSLPEVSTPG